jgi:hypothetical protein
MKQKKEIIKEIINKHNLMTFRHADALNELFDIAFCRGVVEGKSSGLNGNHARVYRKHLDWYSSLNENLPEMVGVKIEVS